MEPIKVISSSQAITGEGRLMGASLDPGDNNGSVDIYDGTGITGTLLLSIKAPGNESKSEYLKEIIPFRTGLYVNFTDGNSPVCMIYWG